MVRNIIFIDRLLSRNDRQKEMCQTIRAGVERYLSAEYIQRTILTMIMPEWPHTEVDPPADRHQRLLETRIDVIPTSHAQPDAVTLRHDDAGRPDLHVKVIDLARLERLLLVAGVIGPLEQHAFAV